MTGLRLRLVLNLITVAIVAVILLDVGLLLWSQPQLVRERRLSLAAAVGALSLELPSELGEAQDAVEALAAKTGIGLALWEPSGRWITSDSTAVLPDVPTQLDGARPSAGFDLLVVALPETSLFSFAAAFVPLSSTVDRMLSLQRQLLFLLVLVALVVIVIGLVLLRRAVLRPLARMTELVQKSDKDALSSFGLQTSDDLSRLSRAIVSMTQQLDEDRRRILWQLEQLRVAHKELESRGQQLVRAERLAVVGKLAAGLAHEIGNPLGVLTGFVDILRDPDLPAADRSASVERMKKELDRIGATVRNLLDFSRAPNHAGGRGDLAAALAHVQQLLVPQRKLREIELVLPTHLPTTPVALGTDALVQLSLNLILNAVEAISATQQPGTVRVGAEVHEGRWLLWVDDSGPGISEADMEQLFEPFFTTKPAGQGTGLGLAVCEHIVTAAGGEIGVEKSPLGGARFRVSLPASRSEEQ